MRNGDAVEIAGVCEMEDETALKMGVGEVGPVGSWGGDSGVVIELEGAFGVCEGGQGGEDGLFAGDFVEDVIIVVVEEFCTTAFEVLNEDDSVLEGLNHVIPRVAVVGEPFEAHDVMRCRIEFIQFIFSEVG